MSVTESRTPAASPAPRKPRTWSRAAMLWLAAWLAVGGWFLTKSNLAAVFTTPAAAVAETPAVAPASTLQTRPIEQLRVGQRLPANNPDVAIHGRKTAVDPATWKLLKLQAVAVWPDGTRDVHEIETLQPPDWLARHDAKVGATVPIPLDLVEMGSPDDLTARVLAIERCPPIEDGPGQVILTTVSHLNRFVFRLTVRDASGKSETLGVTGYHKFYSETRKAWVSAKDLHDGERLGYLQRPVTVAALQQLPGTHRVYNLTVENEHVYYVSGMGALVHNSNCGPNWVNGTTKNPVQLEDFRAPKGGRYGDVRAGNKGGQVHHTPASAVSPYTHHTGPSVWMETADHKLTASWGRSKAAQAYRQKQADLIAQGKIREAVQMDIDDIRTKFGNKYDDHIQEMLEAFGDEF